jgi:hypothetical protein
VLDKPREICSSFRTDCFEVLNLPKETNQRYFSGIYTIFQGNCTNSKIPMSEVKIIN